MIQEMHKNRQYLIQGSFLINSQSQSKNLETLINLIFLFNQLGRPLFIAKITSKLLSFKKVLRFSSEYS